MIRRMYAIIYSILFGNKGMDTITYSLKLDHMNSGDYYNEIEIFTDEVLSKSSESIKPISIEFLKFIKKYDLEEVRQIEEYILELISFGVLWHTYAHVALSVKYAPFILMARMFEWRKKHKLIKPVIDVLRGILLTIFFLPEKTINRQVGVPTLAEVDHVCKWFEATGEFREQALRFIRWRTYWEILNEKELVKVFSEIENFTQWFMYRCEHVLGKYTSKVNKFLAESMKKYKWREDRISCTRTRLEYHLNMVGAELMNRAFNKEFIETDEIFVLLPGCVRKHNNNSCQAKRTKKGLLCSDCEASCRVNVLRQIGIKERFEVYIIPHASDLSLWSPKPGTSKKGVIASACVTTLVEGGWELKRYGVPAQCVLLDYCGCKKHWHAQGLTTALNVSELRNFLLRNINNQINGLNHI